MSNKKIKDLLGQGFLLDQKALKENRLNKKIRLFNDSLTCYKKAFNIERNNLQTIQGMARTLLHKKDFKKALIFYKKGVRIATKKKRHVFLNGLGSAYRYLADYDKSKSNLYKKSAHYYKKAIQNFDTILYWSNLSVTYAALKDWDNALNANKKALGLFSKEKIPHGNLKKILLLENRLYKEYKKRTLS